MPKLLFYIFLTLFGALIISFVHGDNTWKEYGIHLLAVGSIFCLEVFIEHFEHIRLVVLSHTKYRNRKIRLSISYLFQIKVKDKYLLVKGNRVKHQYQPVGGVFKRYRESFYALNEIGVLDDNNIPIDDKSIGDLRIKIPGKNLIKFLKWYKSQLGREVSPHREFYEELIHTEVLEHKKFPYLNYLHFRYKQTPIHFSEHFQCDEILIAEIFKLMPTEEQSAILGNLMNEQSEYYQWVDEESINRKGANLGIVISETASWIL